MDDNAKNAASYHLDQEILDARGISMTVEEVAGLPTTKYSERVQSLRLSDEDLAFLKGLRRRIKNRLASQNSRRRSMEHLRRLTRELRAVRACRRDALCERQALVARRGELRRKCRRLRDHVVQTLRERLDTTEVPDIEVEIPESQPKEKDTPLPPQCELETDKNIFECRIDKLVQQSVNHIFKADKKKVFAKTVFITDEKRKQDKNSNVKIDNYDDDDYSIQNSEVKAEIKDFDDDEDFSIHEGFRKSEVKSVIKNYNDDDKFSIHSEGYHNSEVKSVMIKDFGDDKGVLGDCEGEVLNLSVKEGRRKSHGRKQSAPRRIAYVEYEVSTDDVLDLKVKKEPQ